MFYSPLTSRLLTQVLTFHLALHKAVVNGHTSSAAALIDHKVGVEHLNSQGRQTFFSIIRMKLQ